jgi:hypothetical protein
MTLILSLGNSDQFIQISDRRLTINGSLEDDEANKSGVLICSNARLAYGFTGLARISSTGFDTSLWLNKIIFESCPPDFLAHKILTRVKDRATFDFLLLQELRNIPIAQKGLSIMFSGYLCNFSPPLAVCAIISNILDQTSVQKNFYIKIMTEIRPSQDDLTFIQRVGNYRAMTQKDETLLRSFLSTHKPSKAIVKKAVLMVQEMADRPNAQNTIGKQISSIVIPRDHSPVETYYHSNVLQSIIYMPDTIIGINNETWSAYYGFKMEQNDHRAFVYPIKSENYMCPCGSGKKFKKCHGRK